MENKEICKIRKFLFTNFIRRDKIINETKGEWFMQFNDIIIKDIVTVVRYNTNMRSWRAKNRKNHIIGVKLAGSALHDLGYKKFVLFGNCIYFFNQRDDYDVSVDEPGESFSVHFTTYEEIDSESFCIPINNVSEIVSLLNKAETAKRAGDNLTLYSLVYRLCSELWQISCRSYAGKDGRVAVAKDYIDSHFTEPDCLSRVIADSGITARRFGDLFKRNVGTTPNRYLVLRKVERAKELLSVEGISVSDVAEICGFSDVYYFSKVFKSETGVAPSKWK